ncbi:MAG TPA: hypothetical protein VHM19_18560 [Polyangiales bacterium]|nr:hypothetical protein [Polyangiales bacterium]
MQKRAAASLIFVLLAACGGSNASLVPDETPLAIDTPPPAASGAQAGRYTLLAYRAFRANEQLAIHASFERRVETSLAADGEVQSREASAERGQLDGTLHVITVQEGWPVQLELEVDKLVLDGVPATKGMLVRVDGTELKITRGPALGERALRVLHELVEIRPEPDADRVLATSTPRAVGEAWPVDLDALRDSFERNGTHVEPDALDASAKLLGIEHDLDFDCAKVELIAKVDPLAANEPVPANAMVRHVAASYVRHFMLPVDPANRLQRHTIALDSRTEELHLKASPQAPNTFPVQTTHTTTRHELTLQAPRTLPAGRR